MLQGQQEWRQPVRRGVEAEPGSQPVRSAGQHRRGQPRLRRYMSIPYEGVCTMQAQRGKLASGSRDILDHECANG